MFTEIFLNRQLERSKEANIMTFQKSNFLLQNLANCKRSNQYSRWVGPLFIVGCPCKAVAAASHESDSNPSRLPPFGVRPPATVSNPLPNCLQLWTQLEHANLRLTIFPPLNSSSCLMSCHPKKSQILWKNRYVGVISWFNFSILFEVNILN